MALVVKVDVTFMLVDKIGWNDRHGNPTTIFFHSTGWKIDPARPESGADAGRFLRIGSGSQSKGSLLSTFLGLQLAERGRSISKSTFCNRNRA